MIWTITLLTSAAPVAVAVPQNALSQPVRASVRIVRPAVGSQTAAAGHPRGHVRERVEVNGSGKRIRIVILDFE